MGSESKAWVMSSLLGAQVTPCKHVPGPSAAGAAVAGWLVCAPVETGSWAGTGEGPGATALVLGLTAVGPVAVAAGSCVVAVWVDGISERPRMGRAAVADVSSNSTKATVQALCII